MRPHDIQVGCHAPIPYNIAGNHGQDMGDAVSPQGFRVMQKYVIVSRNREVANRYGYPAKRG